MKEVIFLKIIICDDEPAYVETVSANVHSYLDTHHIRHNIDTFTNGTNVIELIKKYDMAFLDIEMTPISGLDLARKLKEQNSKIIIFMITSFNQYLDEAMDLDVFRYIQKPLNISRLFSGLDKALYRLKQSTIPFYLSDKNKTVRVFSDDIIYIEIINRHTQVVTTNNKYKTDNSIDYWYNHLPKTSFYMVHSSFIINISFITKYERDLVTLNDKYRIPIAYRTRASFKRFFSSYCNN